MLRQLKHPSTSGQLLMISVEMLSIDLDVFSGKLISRLDKYIDLHTLLLKQVRTHTNRRYLLFSAVLIILPVRVLSSQSQLCSLWYG